MAIPDLNIAEVRSTIGIQPEHLQTSLPVIQYLDADVHMRNARLNFSLYPAL